MHILRKYFHNTYKMYLWTTSYTTHFYSYCQNQFLVRYSSISAISSCLLPFDIKFIWYSSGWASAKLSDPIDNFAEAHPEELRQSCRIPSTWNTSLILWDHQQLPKELLQSIDISFLLFLPLTATDQYSFYILLFSLIDNMYRMIFSSYFRFRIIIKLWALLWCIKLIHLNVQLVFKINFQLDISWLSNSIHSLWIGVRNRWN